MAESQLPKAESIFQAIVDLPPEQRESVLAELCGDDDELRALVERLLADHDRGMDSSPEPPALGSTVPSEPRRPFPKRIGHYEILREIGEGGMGTVYEARQENPRRTVAVKVVRKDLTGTSLWKRFQFEAQILGQLNHPGIAQVHEAGTAEDGTPFFAMEYVRGLPLLDCAEKHKLDSRERLALMARICDAVHHAHEKGVIHRDLKPGNILVVESEDGSPQPKILDFGVARAVHSALQPASLHTRTGQLVGTLAYMSPEQVGGHPDELDERSDVYQLGVILYELLAGKRPYEVENVPITEAARIIQEREPAGVSTLDTSFRGDVEVIVARALEKEPGRRYATAAALAEDIRHCLADEAIVARPASAFYRLGKLARRNRAVLITGIAGLVMAAAAVGVALRTERPSGDDPNVAEEVEPSVALVDVRDLSSPEDPLPGAMMTNLVEIGLVESSPYRVVSLDYLKDLRRRMFGTARGPIEPGEALEVARAAGATCLLLCDLADSEGGRSLMWRLVDTEDGEALGARRVEAGKLADLADSTVAGVLPLLAEAMGSEAPAIPSVAELTTVSPEAYRHYTAGRLALQRFESHDAAREFLEAIAIDSTFALAHLDYARLFASASVDRRARSTEKAWALRDRLGLRDRLRLDALRALWTGRPEEQDKAIEIHRETLARWPDDRDAIAELYGLLERYWKDPEYEERLTLTRRGIALYPDDKRMLRLHESCLAYMGRPEESIAALRDFMGRHPEATDLVGDIGGTFLYSMAQPDSAEVYFTQAIESNPTDTQLWKGLSVCSYMRGDVETAMQRLESLLDLRDLPVQDHLSVICQTYWWPGFAQLHAERGQVAQAFTVMQDAERYSTGPMDRRRVESWRNQLRLRVGRAEAVLRSADTYPENSSGRWLSRARALAALDSLDTAATIVEQKRSRPGASGAWWFYYSRKIEADIALAKGRPEDTLDILLSEKRPNSGMQDVDKRESIVRAYRMLGRYNEAEDALREILRWYGGHAVAHYQLGQVLEDMGRLDEALAQYERFLKMWSDADEGLPQLIDARQRIASLRGRSPQ